MSMKLRCILIGTKFCLVVGVLLCSQGIIIGFPMVIFGIWALVALS